jgi:hypothetical protein
MFQPKKKILKSAGIEDTVSSDCGYFCSGCKQSNFVPETLPLNRPNEIDLIVKVDKSKIRENYSEIFFW